MRGLLNRMVCNMKDAYNDTTNDTPRPSPNPFVVPGPGRAEPKTRIDTHQARIPTRDDESRRQGSNPFRWVVPCCEEAVTGESSPAVPLLVNGDGDATHMSTRRTDHNDRPSDDHNNNALDRLGLVGSSLVPSTPPSKTEGDTQSTGLTHPNPGRDTLTEDWDDDDHGDGNRVSTGVLGGNGIIDLNQLREGVQIGTVKRELIDYRPRSKRRTNKKQSRPPFSPQIPKILDFLTKWRIGTTVQLARVAGWRDSNEQRVLKKLRGYDEVGFLRETNLYAGPKIWTATTRGAELGSHPWLGGVKSSEINPMSQSHSFGLSSIASWLLCPWDTTPNILGLDPDEWKQVRGEIKAGTAYVLSEKEYRSSYSSIRTTRAGLLPAEYRHGFIGYGGHENPITGAWREWALRFKNGDSTLADSPELLACDPEFMGAGLWMWIIWGNGVWNPRYWKTARRGKALT